MDRKEKLKEFLKENPKDAFLRHAMALELIKEGKDEEAGKLFEQVLSDMPGYVGSYYHYAKLLERLGQPDEAVKIYERGMHEATQAKDDLAFRELKAAWEELTF